jgi:hypothetical protein
MKSLGRTAILAVVAMAATGALAAQAPASAPATPGKPMAKAVVAEKIFDGGDFNKGDKVTHDFVVSNEGTAPLIITDVRPACGCTVASFDKEIAPGAQGKIHLVLDTLAINGAASKGAMVFTNDPNNAQIELTMRVKVTPQLVMKPGFARFNITRHESQKAMIAQTLYAVDGKLAAITGIDSGSPYVTATYHEATASERLPDGGIGKQFRIEVTLSTEAPVGPLISSLTVHTDDPLQKAIEIPVTGFVRPVIAVTPPVGDFGQVHLTEPLTRTIDVKSFATEPIHVLSADSEGQGIQTKVKSVQDGREYVIEVTLAPPVDKGTLKGRVIIHTDSAKEPVINVDLKGTVS